MTIIDEAKAWQEECDPYMKTSEYSVYAIVTRLIIELQVAENTMESLLNVGRYEERKLIIDIYNEQKNG